MNDEHKNALQASQYDICQELEAEDVLLFLNTKGIVQDSQVEEIMAITRKDMRIMRLIHVVKGAGPSAFQEFINALRFCYKEHLAEKILTHLPFSSIQQLSISETNTTQSPLTSSSTSSQSNTEDWEKPLESHGIYRNERNSGFMASSVHAKGNVSNQSTSNRTVDKSIHGTNVTVTYKKIIKRRGAATHSARVEVSSDNSTVKRNRMTMPAESTTPQTSAFLFHDSFDDAQQSLKEIYLNRFQKVYPFSLPFTFDIENTWVSLALKDDLKNSKATEDHAELLKKAFEKVKMLVIEGNPATGKTSLMRRLAYEWAKGKQELLNFSLVLYAEFRQGREKTFESIVDLVLNYSKTLLQKESYRKLEKLMSNEKFCEERRILILLDGYDESSLEKQCSELNKYLFDSMIGKALVFYVVITTRKGYLSILHGLHGRFVFAEVLGFTTKEQKEKYIFNHFLSKTEIDNKENIATVHNLLDNNENLNKLAETPLFLTFICLVHERIVDGTLLELYCNIIWWLIDRYQKSNLDSDVPSLFGFQNGSSDKFETIQDYYLQFPQLHCLGNMALRSLQENVFKPSDCAQFNLQHIIEQVGLLRKEKNHDNSFKLVTSFFFPHRTIQEFLAAFYCYNTNDPTNDWLSPKSKFNTSEFGMNEFERFLLRIALSDKLPIQTEKRKYYFDKIDSIELDITFDAFNTTGGFKNNLLNWFLSQCKNVRNIVLRDTPYRARHVGNMIDDISIHNESTVKSEISYSTLVSFNALVKLHSVLLLGCTFEANSQLSFTNCPSLENLHFNQCQMKCSTIVGIETLPAIDTVSFHECTYDLITWQSITDQIRNSSVKKFDLTFGKDFNRDFLLPLRICNDVEKMIIKMQNYKICHNDLLSFIDLTKLHSVQFYKCTFETNSQLSFTNCPSLESLQFQYCEIKSSTNLGFATFPAIGIVVFQGCNIDITTWQSITDQIRSSFLRRLKFYADDFVKEIYPEFLHHLQKCEHIEEIHVQDVQDSNGSILKRCEEEVTANLVLAGKKLPGLRNVIIQRGKLSERNKERIEKAGKERNPNFFLKIVE